ncbi:hypothetical protein, partial [Gordonia bronchialis]
MRGKHMDISRRRALTAAAAVGGGVALGVGVPTVGATPAVTRDESFVFFA